MPKPASCNRADRLDCRNEVDVAEALQSMHRHVQTGLLYLSPDKVGSVLGGSICDHAIIEQFWPSETGFDCHSCVEEVQNAQAIVERPSKRLTACTCYKNPLDYNLDWNFIEGTHLPPEDSDALPERLKHIIEGFNAVGSRSFSQSSNCEGCDSLDLLVLVN